MKKFVLGFFVGILVIPAGALAAAWMGWLPVNANAAPGRMETAFAHLALERAVARSAPHVSDPIAPTEENLMAGMKIFKDDCAGCHGDGVRASSWGTTSFYPRVPQLGQERPRMSAEQTYWVVKHGVRYTGMAAWDGLFGKDASGKEISDEKIWTVVTFLSHLDSLPPEVDAEWRKKSGE
ncbi:MAG: cytochrome c [Candidatus Acidiferrum sp.]